MIVQFSLLKKCGLYLKNKVILLRNLIFQKLRARKYQKVPEYGITLNKRVPRLVISLTSFKDRINEVHKTIITLLNQSIKADEIVLWLAEEEFVNKEKELPQKLIELKPYGLSIKFRKRNIKSYKKIMPAITEYPDDIIVLADDDLYYKTNWLELLYNSYLKNSEAIHCHRAHKVCFDENNKILPYEKWQRAVTVQMNNEIYLFTTGAGVLIPHPGKDMFFQDILNENLFMELAPEGDDLWLWVMALLNNTEICIIPQNITELIYVNPARDFGITSGLTLYKSNKNGGNDLQLNAILKHYPELEKIMTEKRSKND